MTAGENGGAPSTDPWAAAAAAWWMSILLLLPVGRPLVNALRERHLLNIVVVAGMAVVFVGLAVVLIRRGHVGRLSRPQLLVALVGAGAVVLVMQGWPRVEERWHVVQYGLLGLLFFLALRQQRRRALVALLLAGAAGWFDEGIQLFLPDRVYDLRDVALNVGAASAGVGLAALSGRLSGVRPKR